MDKCDKCKKETANATWYVTCGLFCFCPHCTRILEAMEEPNKVEIFVGKEYFQNQESRNIKRARKRRKEGLLIWNT